MGLRERVLDAYGGEARWRAARAAEARVSARGWAFRLKFQRPDENILVEAQVGGTPAVWYRPADRDGHTAALEGQTVRLEAVFPSSVRPTAPAKCSTSTKRRRA